MSVVICSTHRTADLRDCLASLFKQEYPYDMFEAIVVTLSEDRDTIEMVRKDFPGACLVVENRKGLSVARNRGFGESKFPIIAFVDDDAVASTTWLKNLDSGYDAERGIGGVGGRVLPPKGLFIPSYASEYRGFLSLFDKGDRPREVKSIVGCNMSYLRDVFVRIGGFRESLGRAPGNLMGNEEVEFARRVSQGGFKVWYQPTAIVYHKVRGDRLSLHYMLRRYYWQGVSDQRMKGEHVPLWRMMYRMTYILLTIGHGRPIASLARLSYQYGSLLENLKQHEPARLAR